MTCSILEWIGEDIQESCLHYSTIWPTGV